MRFFNRILPFAICMIFLIVIFLFVRQRDLNTLTLAVKERDENFIQLAGALSVNGLSIEPLTEVIKGNTDPNLITEGRRLLNSLGYGDDSECRFQCKPQSLKRTDDGSLRRLFVQGFLMPAGGCGIF